LNGRVTPPRFDTAAPGRAYDVAAVREQRGRTRELLGPVDGTWWSSLTGSAAVVTRG
jgi:hypothetical protein